MPRILLLLIALTARALLFAQEYSFSTFGEAHGITQPYIYDISQSQEGYLLFITSEGVFSHDGHNFERLDLNTDIEVPFYKAFLNEKDALWLGTNGGGIYKLHGGRVVHRYEPGHFNSPVVQFLRSGKRLYAFYQNGNVCIFGENNAMTTARLPEEHMYGKFALLGDKIVAGTESGLLFFTFENNTLKVIGEKVIEYDMVESLYSNGNELFIGTASNGLYHYETGKLSKIRLGPGIDASSVKAICPDQLSSFWISVYGKGVYEVKKHSESGKYYLRSSFTKTRGLPGVYITNIFIDRESGMWFGSYGQGLIKLNTNFLIRYKLGKYGLGKEVHSILFNRLQYCGMHGGILLIDPKTDSVSHWKHNAYLPKDNIRALGWDEETRTLLVGTAKSGLYLSRQGEARCREIKLSEDLLSKAINHINVVDGVAYISTLNGLYRYRFSDGALRHFSSLDGLPHNNIVSTFYRSDGNLYIATLASSIFYLRDEKIHELRLHNEFGSLDISAFSEDRQQNLWVATHGQGILIVKDRQVRRIGVSDGLYSEYIYQLTTDKRSSVWAGHRGALARISNEGQSIEVFDQSQDIASDFLPNAADFDLYNNIWFGTNEGIIQYNVLRDKYVDFKPYPLLVSVILNDSTYRRSETITAPYRKNKITVRFRTVSLSDPDNVWYQYRLKNFDGSWSAPSRENQAVFNQLLDGEYILEVRSRIGNGDWSEPAGIMRIRIERPIWKEWWFSLIGLAALVALVMLAISFRTRNLRRQKEKLEEMLSYRTAEIERQKNALKQQYNETQDSIDYAVRIQSSLLPSGDRLRMSLPDSFIFFQPKDKVSGDFYYFEQFGDKFLVAAADATGHGVPGAFMSLIGFTLLKEVIHRQEIDSPDKLLTELDHEINTTLKQFGGDEDGKDGMDMAICEIDLQTHTIRMSSALRPIWLFRKGSFEKIRSSRATVGGGRPSGNERKKTYDLVERQLQPGDMIYLFSDGYVDQFGSAQNKKLMSKRFMNLLRECNHHPMLRQREIISKFLNDWKGDFDQTDDILVIGIRIS